MLYIYKASAGSGKTHLLTGFFLEQLFEKPTEVSEDNRTLLFNEILAVTFTNKATAEMKERIIEELHILSNNPEKSDFIDKLTSPKGNKSAKELSRISSIARRVLTNILENYSDFHISTIDSFFQQVLRSFAHELNVQGNYEIELDADTVLDQAVSQFIVNLDPVKGKETFEWMMEFASKRLDEGSSWNVHQELLKLAKVLTQEKYLQHSQEILDFINEPKALKSYIRWMQQIQQDWKNRLKDIGQEGQTLLEGNKLLATDFKGSSRSAMSCFERWAAGDDREPSDTLKKWATDSNEWYNPKGCPAKGKLSANDENRLQELMQSGIELLIGEARTRYESARAIVKNIYQLGLLSRLEEQARNYCEEKGVQLISSTTQMLSKLIRDEDSPFIYEKTGTRIQSYMIDEFQDTSTLQWNNFKPLLDNSISNGNKALVVGDVKQSIYRWRGSDWELLNSKINDFRPEMHEVDEDNNQLKFNFRSDRKIIAFNNAFFAYASEKLSKATDDPEMQNIAKIYSDVKQDIHSSREDNIEEGLLHYEEVEASEDAEDNKASTEAVLRRLPEMVIALQQKGFQPGEILILGRYNKDCKLFAESLLAYKKEHPESHYSLDIITDEALSLANRDIIMAVITMLHAIYQPKSELCQTIAHCNYLKAIGLPMSKAVQAHFSSKEALPDLMQYSNLPLYEMVESLIALIPQAEERDGIFLQAFRDIVLEHVAKRGTDLGGFLEWWDEKKDGLSISTPASKQAIRIMTIHKSKGLGEKAVIIPLANWNIDIQANGHDEILWLDPSAMGENPEGYPTPKILPIKLDSSLPKTIFKQEYADERTKVIIDNLNTAYVAFTRAKKAMTILAPAPQKPKKENKKESPEGVPNLGALLKEFFSKNWEKPNDKIDLEELQEDTPQNCAQNKQKEKVTQTTDKSIASRPVIKKTVFTRSENETARGTTIHNALSVVKYADDYEEPIRQLFLSGRAELDGIGLDELVKTIGELIHQSDTAAWFASGNRVLNEQNIVTHTTHTQRPDRVVFTPDGKVIIIDYKSGSTHTNSYHKQVQYYMKLMRDMGFKNVEGYLWYIDQHEIVPVQSEQQAVQLSLDFS